MSWLRRVSKSNDGLTIAITGPENMVPEPALLEALAHHPKVAHVLFIPLHGNSDFARYNKTALELDEKLDRKGARAESRHCQYMQAYDLKPLFKDHKPGAVPDTDALREEIRELIETKGSMRNPNPIEMSKVDMLIGRNNWLDADDLIGKANPNLYFLNHRMVSHVANDKTYLPHFKDAIGDMLPHCAMVRNTKELEDFRSAHAGEPVVIKLTQSLGGHGVGKVFEAPSGKFEVPSGELMVEAPNKLCIKVVESPEGEGNLFTFPAKDLFFARDGFLAMQWLEPQRGDIRALLIDGKFVGGYKRIPKKNETGDPAKAEWRANGAQGGSCEPITPEDLSPQDLERINHVAANLKRDYGLNWVAADLLADPSGKRYVSELNMGLTDDIGLSTAYAAQQRATPDEPLLSDKIADHFVALCERHRAQPVTHDQFASAAARVSAAAAQTATARRGG